MTNNLYDELAKRWLIPGGSLWIFSDTHFSDVESYELRGLLNVPADIIFAKEQGDSRPYDLYVEERLKVLDDMQIKNINSKVGRLDTIIFLGDIGDIECIKKIKARYKILLLGNHDKGASNYRREVKSRLLNEKDLENGLWYLYTYEEDNHLFDEVYEGPLMINDKVILSHEPILPLPSYLFNIHGHDHTCSYIDDNHLNVIAEKIHYSPVNLVKLLQKGLTSKVKNIHRVTIDKASKDRC